MIVEQFANGNSCLHSLDPRAKIIGAGLFSVLVAVADAPACLVTAALLSLLLLALSRLPLQRVLRHLLPVNVLLLFLWCFLPFTHGGQPLFTVGPLVATREGVVYATLITVKSNAIVLVLITLVATSPIMTLGHALSHLRVPEKLIHLFFFTFRYIQVIHQEYLRLRNAMKVRGFQPKTTLHTYRSYGYLVGMLLIRSLDRAERVRKAMLCRGFQGRFFLISHFEFKKRDLLFSVAMAFGILCMGVLQWMYLI